MASIIRRTVQARLLSRSFISSSAIRNSRRQLRISSPVSRCLTTGPLPQNGQTTQAIGDGRSSWRNLVIFMSILAAPYLMYQGSKPILLDSDESNPAPSQTLIPYEEVQKHTSPEDCWVVVKGNVYDLTDFLRKHPGGQQAILREAGKDASALFFLLHSPDLLNTLPPEACLGPVDPDTLPPPDATRTEEELRQEAARRELPDVEDFLLIQEFENWAEKVISKRAWGYYRSAADEERSFDENRDAFRRYFFRPRVVTGVKDATTETTYLGIPTALPIYISPAAAARMGHPLGEVNLTRAAGDCDVVQGISTYASCSVDEIFAAKRDEQTLVYQLYLNIDRAVSEQLIRKVDKLGAKAILWTVDVSGDSKRTLDTRVQRQLNGPAPPSMPVSDVAATLEKPVSKPFGGNRPLGATRVTGGTHEQSLVWEDLAFIRKHTKLPVIVKGVQCVEDIQLCVDHGAQGVIISNHGGRQADYAPAPIDILYETRILRPDLFDKIDIFIDGGVRSGADVVKAIALGAKSVGIGRPFLYANGTHGEAGVRRVLEILHDEILGTMENIGASKISDLKPEMVGPAGPWVGTNRPPYVKS